MISSRKITDFRKESGGGGGGCILDGTAGLPEPHLGRLAAADCTFRREGPPGRSGRPHPPALLHSAEVGKSASNGACRTWPLVLERAQGGQGVEKASSLDGAPQKPSLSACAGSREGTEALPQSGGEDPMK